MMSSTLKFHEYEIFELLVGDKTADGYPLTLTQSPVGGTQAYCQLNPDDQELLDALEVIDVGAADEKFLAQLGSYLFEELFAGEIADLYRTSLGIVRERGKRLRIRLHMGPPELATLPWEYMHDEQEDTSLAISSETALVRYIPLRLPTRPTLLEAPLRVLVVISAPHDMPALNAEQEKRAIEEALADQIRQKRVELQILELATVSEISQTMRRFRPHVFHFIGHGVLEQEEAYIALEDEAENAHMVNERIFRELFSGSRETRLAVLNACETASMSSTQPFVGLAPRLLQRQLSAVVAMQYPIPDETAQVFARDFYRSLALGYPVDAAVSEARRGIFLEMGEQASDWGIPVLFLRAHDGHLFEIQQAVEPKSEYPPPFEPAHLPQTLDFVGRQSELAYFTAQIRTTGSAIILGMAGVGKTTLAAKLAQQISSSEKIFWHSFQENASVQTFIWELAGFLAWHGQDELWKLLNTAQQASIPAAVLVDHLIQMIRGHSYLLCIDDVQVGFTDPLVYRIVDRLRQSRDESEVTLIMTARSIPDFVQETDIIPLAGLNIDATRELLANHGIQLPDLLLDALHEKTEGNPQLLTMVINTLRQHQEPEQIIERLVYQDKIERYLLNAVDEGLGQSDRDILSAVAVLSGHPGTQGAIEAILDRGNLRRELRSLCDRFLLLNSNGSSQQEYRLHAILQDFYYNLLNPQQQRTWHRQAAEYYELDEPDMFKAAFHYEQCRDVAKAIHYLDLAGTQAQQIFAYRNARDFYQRAQELSTTAQMPQSDLMQQQISILVKLAEIHQFLGEYTTAQQCCQKSLRLAQRHQMRGYEAESLRILGSIARNRSEYAKSIEYLTTALEINQELGDLTKVAKVQRGLGMVALNRDNYAEAKQLYHNVLSMYREEGEYNGEAQALIDLGNVHEAQGEYARAKLLYQDALSINKHIGEPIGKARALRSLGDVAWHQGEYGEATRLYSDVLGIYQDVGDRRREAEALRKLGNTVATQEQYLEATQLYQEALSICQDIGDRNGEANTLNNLGVIARDQSKYEDATRLYQEALTIHRRTGSRHGEAAALINLGNILEYQERYPEALQLVEEALSISKTIGYPIGEAESLLLLGYIALKQDELDKAQYYFLDSLEINQNMGQVPTILVSLVGLACVQMQEGNYEKALKWVGFTLNHPATNGDVTARVKPLLAEIEDKLSANRVTTYLEQGKLLDQKTLVEEALQTHRGHVHGQSNPPTFRHRQPQERSANTMPEDTVSKQHKWIVDDNQYLTDFVVQTWNNIKRKRLSRLAERFIKSDS